MCREDSKLKMKRSRYAQSFLEYAFLISVISTALMAMLTYINRAMNARLKQVQVELNDRYRGTEQFMDVPDVPKEG